MQFKPGHAHYCAGTLSRSRSARAPGVAEPGRATAARGVCVRDGTHLLGLNRSPVAGKSFEGLAEGVGTAGRYDPCRARLGLDEV